MDKNKNKKTAKLLGDPLHKCRNYRKDILRVKSSSSIEMIMGKQTLNIDRKCIEKRCAMMYIKITVYIA